MQSPSCTQLVDELVISAFVFIPTISSPIRLICVLSCFGLGLEGLVFSSNFLQANLSLITPQQTFSFLSLAAGTEKIFITGITCFFSSVML